MLVPIGNFFFKWRDYVFPMMLLLLVVVPPVQGDVFGIDEGLLDVIGIVAMLAGELLRIGVVGLKYIKRGGLDKKVYADDLVTGGLFSVCRNPLYVGNILIALGALVIHAQPALMLAGIGATLLVYVAIVAAEESFLRGKFGAGYDEYCADVGRWVPSLSRLPAALRGADFNLRRVVAKEYSTIAGVAAGITLLLSLETHALTGVLPAGAFYALAAVATFALGVRSLKKTGYLRG